MRREESGANPSSALRLPDAAQRARLTNSASLCKPDARGLAPR